MKELAPTIKNSGNPELIKRIQDHLGLEFLDLTADIIAGYHDGGFYGGCPDPRSRAAMVAYGRETSKGGTGPKKHSE